MILILCDTYVRLLHLTHYQFRREDQLLCRIQWQKLFLVEQLWRFLEGIVRGLKELERKDHNSVACGVEMNSHPAWAQNVRGGRKVRRRKLKICVKRQKGKIPAIISQQRFKWGSDKHKNKNNNYLRWNKKQYTHTLGFIRIFLSIQATVPSSVGSAAVGFLF